MKMKIQVILTMGAISLLEVMPFSGNVAWGQQRPTYSAAYCESYARNYAKRNSSGGALKGAVGGAATGALVGVVLGGGRGAKKGGRIGTVVGAISGGARKSSSYERLFSSAYDDCRRGYLQR
jgi:hypothetical protein